MMKAQFNDILSDVQDYLHERGLQLMEKKFNGKLENITFMLNEATK